MPRVLVDAFDSGRIAEALIGDGDFKIVDPLWRVHDRLLTVRSLSAWALDDERRVAARVGVDKAAGVLLGDGRSPEVVDLIWCHILVEQDGAQRLVDPSRLLELLDAAVLAWGSPLMPDPSGAETDATVRAIREALR